MPSIPDFLPRVLIPLWGAVLAWLSHSVYQGLRQSAPQPLLVRVEATLDLRPLETTCAPYHAASGPGAPVTHPVARLLRALLVDAL